MRILTKKLTVTELELWGAGVRKCSSNEARSWL